MFDSLKNLGSMAGLLKDLPRIKAELEQMKIRLGQMTVDAETGGGAVRVTANGLLEIVSIEVDQALLVGIVDATDPQDKAMAEDRTKSASQEWTEATSELFSDYGEYFVPDRDVQMETVCSLIPDIPDVPHPSTGPRSRTPTKPAWPTPKQR